MRVMSSSRPASKGTCVTPRPRIAPMAGPPRELRPRADGTLAATRRKGGPAPWPHPRSRPPSPATATWKFAPNAGRRGCPPDIARARRARSPPPTAPTRAPPRGSRPTRSRSSPRRPAADGFWAAAVEMGMPLTVHVGFDRLGPRAAQPTFEDPDADPEVLRKLGPRKIVEWVALPFLGIPPALSMAQLILSGVFDRLPDLKIF